ncbi:uncharacterized protein LOC142985770 [Anticarsia gemmatalis]|uniref:uncharacterized protein LOC142985770 n=1 Tax=Anticarsia gemmatalis TaxID=129554 RepID=UPI003F775C4A
MRTLNVAATGLLDIVEALADRTVSDEVRRIQVEFSRLRRENDALKAERKSLLLELEQASATTATRATCPPPAPAVSTHTCVRHNGGSIVDLSFATPAVARRVAGWRVEEDVETLSDHLYIRFVVSPPSGGAASVRRPVGTFPRWNLGRLDKELAEEAAIVHRWFAPRPEEGADTEVLAGRMHTILTEVCDAAMPRARRRPARKSVYWWTPEIAELRIAANRARRAHARCQARNRRAPGREGADVELAELREQGRDGAGHGPPSRQENGSGA